MQPYDVNPTSNRASEALFKVTGLSSRFEHYLTSLLYKLQPYNDIQTEPYDLDVSLFGRKDGYSALGGGQKIESRQEAN